jgi:hypothetical protein
MVAHAQVPEAKAAYICLSAIDHRQLLQGYEHAVGDARRETRHSRLVPGRQSDLFRQGADLGFGQLGLFERAAHAVFGHGLHARTIIVHVIQVRAFDDPAQTLAGGKGLELGEELGFAMVAAVSRVLDIERVI